MLCRLRVSKIYDCRASLCGKLMPAALLRMPEGEVDAKILIAALDAADTRLLHRQRRDYDVLRSVCSGHYGALGFIF